MRSTQVFPKKDGWATPRTDEIQLTDENCQIILPKKIDHITKVTLSLFDSDNNKLCFTDGGGDAMYIKDRNFYHRVYDPASARFEYRLINAVDLTPFVVEQQEWQTLGTLEGRAAGGQITEIEKLKDNTWYYTRGSNAINVIATKLRSLLLQSRTVIDEIIQYSLFAMSLYIYSNGQYIPFPDGFQKKVTTALNSVPQKLLINVEYVPLGESAKVTANKTETLQTEYLTPYSQTQPLASSQQFGKNMTATANRTGVETRTVCRKVRNYTDIRQVGTIWQETDVNGAETGNVWRLTVNDIKYVGGFYDCTETWAKNWSSQSEFVGINREFRSWNIPADIVQRNVVYQDYVFLTDDDEYIGGESALTYHAKAMILQGLLGTTTTKTAESEGNLLYVYRAEPTDSNQDGVILGVSAFAFGNSLVFSAKPRDNLSAGINRTEISGSVLCRDVYYCDDDGKLDEAWFTLCPSYTNDDTDYFPACSLTKNKAGGNKIIEKLRLYLDKDPAEQVNFTYQVHFASNLPQIVIGCGWANNCPLIAPRERTVTLKKWTLTAQLPQGAQTMSSYYGTAGHDSDLNINTTDYWVEVPAKFCLTDSENNVIIANNSEATVRVYLKFTHDYESMARRNAVLFGAKYKDAI